MKFGNISGRQNCNLKLDAQRGGGMRIENVRLLAQDSPFAGLYQPDDSKAFMEFEICNSFPDFLGPVAMGKGVANYCCFFPDTLAASHESLRLQQLNLRHLLAAYGDDPKAKDANVIRNDRIIGAVVATDFPAKPTIGGWRTPGNPQGATAKIACCAVLFKLAQGVDKLIGGHLSNKQPQSVSIEVNTSYDNLGVYIPSRDEMVPLIDPTEEVFSAYKIVRGQTTPIVGELNGEQLLISYGMGGNPVHFAGVGVTATPAEKSAKILRMTASKNGVVGIAAESVFQTIVGQKVTFSTKRTGVVRAVHSEGLVKHALAGFTRKATADDPVLAIEMPDRVQVLRHYSELAGRLW